MISDNVRYQAYKLALSLLVTPKSVVLDLGTGIGWMAVMAARLGARRVYAVDTNPLIALGPRIAEENGVADRLRFIRGSSMEIELPEPVDILVSDLRGSLPLAGDGLKAVEDARRRHLRPDGHLIPQQDELLGALVESPEAYGVHTDPWRTPIGDIKLDSVLATGKNCISKVDTIPQVFLHRPQTWGIVNYQKLETKSFSGELSGVVENPGTVHGISLWFRTTLANSISFETSPEREPTIYGNLFLPIDKPLSIELTDHFIVRLRADRVRGNYVYSWKSFFFHQNTTTPFAAYDQSTFYSEPVTSSVLSRYSDDYHARLTPIHQADVFALSQMNGKHSNEEIAKLLLREFPMLYRGIDEALDRVCSLAVDWTESQSSKTDRLVDDGG